MNVNAEIRMLEGLSNQELKERYAVAFGEEPLAHNRHWLMRRIAWRLQALHEGGLSNRSLYRAAELANEADIRTCAPKLKTGSNVKDEHGIIQTRDPRIPPPGSVLRRRYKGEVYQVVVLEDCFEWDGNYYASLSAASRAITGMSWSGFHFFGLTK